MSASTPTATTPAATTRPLDLADEGPARFRDLVAGEWIKLRSLRSTYWVLGVAALVIVGFNVNHALSEARNWDAAAAHPLPDGFAPDSIWAAVGSAFTTNANMVLLLVAGCVGASVVVGELSSGLVRTTFIAVPARRSLMAAKVAVVAPVFLAFGTLVSGLSFGLTQAILSREDIGLSITHPGAWRIVVASALAAPVAALVGMAVGAVVRHTATTMVTTPFVLVVLPTFFDELRHQQATLKHAMVQPAWQRLTEIGPIEAAQATASPYPWDAAGAWVVLAAWAAVAATIAVVALHRRDV